MKPRTSEAPRRSRNLQGETPNWILIAGSALLSTLSIRLGFKLKQVLDGRQANNSSRSIKDKNSNAGKKTGSCPMDSNGYYFPRGEGGGRYNGYTESRNTAEMQNHSNGQIVMEPDMALPLVTIPTSVFNKENGVIWSSSPERIEQAQRPFHHFNGSESPCVSESGSDIFSKREVILKLRQQVKRRDDTILEMQDQIAELQSLVTSQKLDSSHLQSLLDASNKDLFDLEGEVQRLRKAIADRCVGYVNSNDKPRPSNVPVWSVDERNGDHINGYPQSENNSGKGREGEKIESLKKEVAELKELIETKDYLLQSYKEQKSELSVKIKALQLRLDSQLSNIL